MLKRLPYSLWKNYYRSFPADQYDQGTKTILVDVPKTILVDVPKTKTIRWPKDWKRSGNHYLTPGGCLVHFWNTGLAQNYYVEHIKNGSLHRTINPGIDSRQRVLDAVKHIEAIA